MVSKKCSFKAQTLYKVPSQQAVIPIDPLKSQKIIEISWRTRFFDQKMTQLALHGWKSREGAVVPT
jgi:hypothetical protein